MVAPPRSERRFNSSEVPRNAQNLHDYVNSLSDDEAVEYILWRTQLSREYIAQHGDAVDEHREFINNYSHDDDLRTFVLELGLDQEDYENENIVGLYNENSDEEDSDDEEEEQQNEQEISSITWYPVGQ